MWKWLLIPCVLGFAPNALAQACQADATTLCLNQGRFEVSVAWSDAAGNPFTLAPGAASGDGLATALFDDVGVFAFTDPSAPDMMVKVLNGCAVNDRFWVFAGAHTNVAFTLTVRDSLSNEVRLYTNPQDNKAVPVTDTSAFEVCSLSTMTAEASRVTPDSGESQTKATGNCVPDAQTLCLLGGRFSVRIDWAVPSSSSGSATGVPLGPDAGYFWFFNSSNPEIVVKLLDGRGVNGFVWVYFSGLSNVETVVKVTDTATNESRHYTSPLGEVPVVLDNRAFGEPLAAIPTLSAMALPALGLLLAVAGWLGLRRTTQRTTPAAVSAAISCRTARHRESHRDPAR